VAQSVASDRRVHDGIAHRQPSAGTRHARLVTRLRRWGLGRRTLQTPHRFPTRGDGRGVVLRAGDEERARTPEDAPPGANQATRPGQDDQHAEDWHLDEGGDNAGYQDLRHKPAYGSQFSSRATWIA
jgi:hypothetical protein